MERVQSGRAWAAAHEPAPPGRPARQQVSSKTSRASGPSAGGALLAALLVAQLAADARAFNLDTQTVAVHSGPAGSQFGYSVALHRDRGVHWLLVGAPRAKTDQPATSEAGAVYRCTPGQARACQQLAFDPNGPATISVRSERLQADNKSHQGFGASLASAPDSGSIVACAPRYVYHSTNLRRRDPVGTCWVSRGSFAGFLEYSPCRQNDKWGHHSLGSCQAGFSSAITKDGGRLFMGAPGAHVWQGQVFGHDLRTDLTNSTSAVNPHSEDDSYVGYSLALGRFSAGSGRPDAQPDLAIGVPRAHQLAGKIMLVDSELRPIRNLSGEQMGAYFGYALAAVDLNGDGLDDLLVGAPFHFDQSHKEPQVERGRVYVFLQGARNEFALAQRLDGARNGARFGSALANLGDLNRDGLQDAAVGAPHDGPDQRGAVYVYLGRRGPAPLAGQPDQVIWAEALGAWPPEAPGALRTFGAALSAGLDVDANQYPDLLVGAPGADRAVLLRARPVVSLNTSISFSPEHLNLDDRSCLLPNSSAGVTCITVQYCAKYSGPSLEPRLGFVYDIKLDADNKGAAPRLLFLANEPRSEDRISQQLSRDVNHCRSFRAYLARQLRDKLTPLRVDIELSLADQAPAEPSDQAPGLPRLRPVLNRLASSRMSKAASIQKNCGPDNVCVPDLRLSVTPNLDQYTIGSQERLVLDVQVSNLGEDAFESMFYLTMPMSINFITINKTRSDYPVCYGAKPDQTGVNLLTCDLGNPQQRNDLVRFSVVTEPARGAQLAAPDFTFVAQVNSTNPERDQRALDDNQVAIGIPIRVEAQLALSGSSQPPLVVHNSTLHQLAGARLAPARHTSEADLGQEVYHTYQLQNRGPSTINDIALTILWPSRTSEGRHLLYLVDEPFTDNKVLCRAAPEGSINPLNLKYLRGNSMPPAGAQLGQFANSTTGNDLQSHYYSGGQNYQLAPRLRRQLQDEQPQPSALAQVGAGPPATSVDQSLLSCDPRQCTHFQCNVHNLAHNEIATIRIRARLYEDTINELSLQKFDISSKLVAQIKSLPYNVSTLSMPPYQHKVETQVHTTGIAFQDILPWWLIFLAILLGVLLFVLLACFLRYLGFFARKRPPKGAEREPLTPTMWNDYHYTPGDTAL